MRKQCPQLVFFKLNTIDTLIKPFIHSFIHSNTVFVLEIYLIELLLEVLNHFRMKMMRQNC